MKKTLRLLYCIYIASSLGIFIPTAVIFYVIKMEWLSATVFFMLFIFGIWASLKFDNPQTIYRKFKAFRTVLLRRNWVIYSRVQEGDSYNHTLDCFCNENDLEIINNTFKGARDNANN